MFSADVLTFSEAAEGRLSGEVRLDPANARTPDIESLGFFLLSHYGNASHVGFDAWGFRAEDKPFASGEERIVEYDVVGSFAGQPRQ